VAVSELGMKLNPRRTLGHYVLRTPRHKRRKVSFTFLTAELSKNDWMGKANIPLGAVKAGNQGGRIDLYKVDAWS
jgi:hypothetical protein